MARIRSVHPDICESATLAKATASAERTFVRLWTACDDHGRTKGDPRLLKGKLYPLHDDITANAVADDLDELAGLGLIRRYTVGGTALIDIPSWDEYQHPNKPAASKLPGFPGDVEEIPEPPQTPAGIPRDSETPAVGVETGVGEGEGVLCGTAAPPAPKPTDDPVKARAHELAVFAFEQPVKPDIANARNGPFVAVLQLLERRLRAGVPVNVLRDLIAQGVEVWTLAGLQTAEARLKSARTARDPNDTQRRIAERVEQNRAREVALPMLGGGAL